MFEIYIYNIFLLGRMKYFRCNDHTNTSSLSKILMITERVKTVYLRDYDDIDLYDSPHTTDIALRPHLSLIYHH